MAFLSDTSIFGALAVCVLIGTVPVQSQQAFRTSWVRGNEVPYHASIWLHDGFLCSATIIDHQFVLTAAHCVKGLTPEHYSDMKVRTGVTGTRSTGKTHYIKAIHTHPDFEFSLNGLHANDIAVVKLTKFIKMNRNQRAIPIAKEDPPAYAKLTLSGWGIFHDKYSHVLRKAASSIVSNKVCEQKTRKTLRPNQMCTYDETEQDICIADSGSSLVYKNKLVGMVSWMGACGSDSPLVYVKIEPYRVFLTQAMSIR